MPGKRWPAKKKNKLIFALLPFDKMLGEWSFFEGLVGVLQFFDQKWAIIVDVKWSFLDHCYMLSGPLLQLVWFPLVAFLFFFSFLSQLRCS